MHAQGSPQLFQTGGRYQGVSLVNYQHRTICSWARRHLSLDSTGRVQYYAGAYAVRSPTQVNRLRIASPRGNP